MSLLRQTRDKDYDDLKSEDEKARRDNSDENGCKSAKAYFQQFVNENKNSQIILLSELLQFFKEFSGYLKESYSRWVGYGHESEERKVKRGKFTYTEFYVTLPEFKVDGRLYEDFLKEINDIKNEKGYSRIVCIQGIIKHCLPNINRCIRLLVYRGLKLEQLPIAPLKLAIYTKLKEVLNIGDNTDKEYLTRATAILDEMESGALVEFTDKQKEKLQEKMKPTLVF